MPTKPAFKIATQPLYIGFARAHNPGDRVPVENIDVNGWGDMVVSEDTKAAKAAEETPETAAPAPPKP